MRFYLFAFFLVLMDQLVCIQGRLYINGNLVKRQARARAWINGKEVDVSRGGTYRDNNGNFVSVSNSGNGVSMISSSGGAGGCTIVGDTVHESDGSTRPLNDQDRQMLANYNRQIGDFFRNMFPPGFPFIPTRTGRAYPSFPPICQSNNDVPTN